MANDTPHKSEVVEMPKIHRMGLTFHELDMITAIVIKETERATDRAFSEKRTEQDVHDAVFWRGLSKKLQDRRDLADSRE